MSSPDELNLGHMKTYDIIDKAKDYVVKYYETDSDRHLNNPALYAMLKEAARRWALADLGKDKRIENPENYVEIVAHEAVTNLFMKLVKKEVDLELFSYYYKTIIRNRIIDVFREYKDEKNIKNIDSIMVEGAINFSSEEEVTELIYLVDKAKLLLKYINSCLKSSLLTRRNANLLVIPILLCVIRDSTKLVDNYPFRVRVFLRKVIFEARSLYLREFIN